MVGCREFFEQLRATCEKEGGAIRGPKLRENGHAIALAWENESASAQSPGVVQTEERVRLALFEGQQVMTGTLHRQAFDPLMKIGFSTDRCAHISLDQCRDRALAKAARGTKPAAGYIDIDVAFLRHQTCRDDQSQTVRAIGVYDTAVPDNKAHAESFYLYFQSNSIPHKTIAANLMDEYKDKIQHWPKAA